MKPSWFRTLLSRPARVRDAQRRQKRKYLPILERFEDRLAPARLSIPTNFIATPGTIVTVPINIDNLNPDPANGGVGGLTGADFVLFYDANVFSVANADVKVGSLLASTSFATNPNSTTAGQLFIGVSDSSGIGFSGFAGGTLVTVDFHVKSSPTPGASLIDLAATNLGNAPFTGISDQNFGPYVLFPPPQDGFDANDGSVFIDVGSHFTLAAPGGVTAGVPFNLTVTAVDGSNNPLPTYTGIVHFSSTDAQAVLPSDTTLVNGTGIFSVTLKTAGNRTLTATDSVTATINGAATIAVNAGAATHFTVGAPANVEAGVSFNVTVAALDQFGNTATGYSGSVAFTSSDPISSLPSAGTLSNGVRTFLTTLKTSGSQTITATDTTTASITGTSSTINVIATTAEVFGNTLIVSGSNFQADELTIAYSSAANVYTLTNSHPIFASSIPGATGSGTTSVTIPGSAFTGQIQVSSKGGDDTLTLDFGSGNPIPASGLIFNGGAGGHDTLVVTGGNFGTVVYDATQATNGTVNLDGSIVTFTGLEPVDLTSSTIADFTINVDPGNGIAGTVTTTVAAVNTTDTLISFTSGLESTHLRTITGTLTINGDNVDTDSFDVQGVGSFFAASLTTNGQGGTDSVTFSGDVSLANNKSLSVTAESVTTAANVDLVTSGTGTISFIADDIELNSSSTLVSASTVSLLPQSSGRAINVGTETVGSLSLTSGELNVISAATIAIGKEESPSTITISSSIQHTGDASFFVTTGRNILFNSGTVWTSAAGNLTFSANQGATPTAGNFVGIDVNGATVQVTGAGELLVNGRGGDHTIGFQYGVQFRNAAKVMGGVNGTNLTITGLGGTSLGNDNYGVHLHGANSEISSHGGNVAVIGAAGGTVNTYANQGVVVNIGRITAGGAGEVAVTATGGAGIHPFKGNCGLLIGGGGEITSGGGNVSVTSAGTPNSPAIVLDSFAVISSGGNADVTITADSIEFLASTALIRAGAVGNQTVTIKPKTAGTLIDLGGADVVGSPLTLGLTDAELGRITAATLIIGRNDTGNFTVSDNFSRSASTNVELITAGTLAITGGTMNTGGGTFTATVPTVTLQKDIIASTITGTATQVSVAATGQIQDAIDVAASGGTVNIASGTYSGNVSATGKAITLSPGSSLGQVTITGDLTLDSNDSLAIEINGANPTTSFDNLIVNGTVTLGGATFSSSGTRAANVGNVLVLIKNDAADSVSGIFQGHAEGSVLSVNNVPYAITYKHNAEVGSFGNGNDVALVDITGAHFVLTTLPGAPAGKLTNFMVALLDGNNHAVPSYSGTVHITSSDSAAVLPADATLTNGVGTFSVTLVTLGNQTLTATDISTGSITGTSNPILVRVNQAPTQVDLSNNLVAENRPSGSSVGSLSATDADVGDPTTFSLVTGAGSDDNASFTIDGITLKTAASFNFETKSSFTIRIRGTDECGEFFEATFTINVTNVNETPTNLTLTPGSIAENQPIGTAVGTLATTDPDVGNTFTYSLVTGTGSTDNASFTVSGDTLHTAAVFNFEVKSTYSIRLRTTDQDGLFFNRIFTITVTDANDAPTNIGLNGNTVTENAPIGTAIGNFSTTDIEPSNDFDYTLVSGAGSTDNAYFSIIGNTLQVATPPDFETKTVLSIRVRSTDEGDLFFEKTFTITVVDVDETVRRFTITGPTSVTAGDATTYTVTALDQFDNPATGYSGTIHFTSTDSAAALPSDATLASSTGTFSVTLQTAGNRTITVSDTTTPSINGTSGTISVAHAAASHFGVTASSSVLAGNGLIVIVVALDDFNNTATNYSGEVQFTSSDSHAGLPGAGPLNSGQGFFAATLQTSGSQTLTVSDTVTPSISGVANINVLARPASHFVLSAPASTTAGTTISVTVSARDQFENISTSYAGTVHFASSDAAADLPTDTTLTGGAGTYNVTLKTAASTSVSVIDTVNGSLFGSASVQVTPAAVTHFDVNTSSTTTAGANLIVSITALDSFQNVVTDYTGTVGFSSSDPQAILPASTELIAGAGLFVVTFKTAGTQTITLADSESASIFGASNNITVSASVLHHFGLTSVPASILTGNPFSFSVAAQDQFNNVIAAYTGTVHFSSSDASAALPANTTLTGGVGTFSATLKTPGQQTLSASDVTTPSITGTSSVISAHGLEVSSITTTATGFSATFNKPFDATPINLYDLLGFFGVTDVALARGAVQTITFSPSMANNSTFTLTFNGATTAPITCTNTSAAALAANIQTALDALSTIGVGNTLVSAVNSNSVSVTFQNTLGFKTVSLLKSSSPGGVPNPVQIANTIQGSANLRGTLLVNSDNTSLTFQLTGTGAASVLSRGNYQITLRSAADGFKDLLGNSLDGNSDLAAGGDYVTTFSVAATPSVILSIPDFARGPDDIYNVRIPNNAGEEVQTMSFNGTAPGSTFSLAFNGVTTSAITYSSVTATLQNNIQQALLSASMTSITNSRDLGALVTAVNSTSVTVRFLNVMGGFNQPQLTTATPSVTIATTTEGVNTGIPVTLSGAAGVTDLEFDLVYNPNLLTVTGAYNLATSAGPVGSSLTLVGTPASGVAHFHFNIGTAAPLSANATLGHIVAQVPTSAANKYKSKQLLQLTNIVATGAATSPVGNNAVHVAAYFGDASGDGTIDPLDGALTSRVNSLLDGGGANSLRVGGLGAYRMLDPYIMTDFNNTGFVDSGDVSLIRSYYLVSRPQIPMPPPFSTLSLAPAGPDPTLSLPSDLHASPGETIVVPINIDTTRPAGSPGMMGATLALRYDASMFTVSAADIQLGSFVSSLGGAESSGWQLSSSVSANSGEIGISIFSIQPIVSGSGGSLVTVTLHVRQGVSATTSAINLVTAVNPSGQQEYVTSVSDGISQYILHPVITDGFDAGVDGRVTLPAPILSTSLQAAPPFVHSTVAATAQAANTEPFALLPNTLPNDSLPELVLQEIFGEFEATALYLTASGLTKPATTEMESNRAVLTSDELTLFWQDDGATKQDWMLYEPYDSLSKSPKRGRRLQTSDRADESEETGNCEPRFENSWTS